LLAIAQAYNAFNYLHWVPSEAGPLVTEYGNIVVSDVDLRSPSAVNQIISSIKSKVKMDIPVIAISLDSSEVYLSGTSVPAELDPVDVLTWHSYQSQDEKFAQVMDSYHYPFADEVGKYLNIYIPRSKKNSIIESIKQYKAEIRSLGVGIFSAESCARYCFAADKNSTYIIWRLGKYNSDQVLLIGDSGPISYCEIKRTQNNAKLQSAIGDQDAAEDIRSEIERYLKGELTGFRTGEHVYVYQADEKYLDVRKIIDAALDNVTLLNPLKMLKVENSNKVNLQKTSYLAETGLVFRGLDV